MKLSPVRILILVAVIALVVAVALGQRRYAYIPNEGIHGAPGARKVLFVGNSHTFKNDAPYLVQQLVPAGSPPLEFVALLAPGRTLGWHIAAGDIPDEIARTTFDTVVIQPQSQEIVARRTQFMADARRLAGMMGGARTVLFQTWPHDISRRPESYGHGLPTTMQQWADVTLQTARETGLPVAPVGSVFLCTYNATRLDLWNPDGYHPSLAGSFVAALVLLRSIYSIDVSKTTWRPPRLPGSIADKLRGATVKCLSTISG